MNQPAQADLSALRAEALQLAGGLGDLAQRATVYRQLYRVSGGNHIFPLIAAHGALWAGDYFRLGVRLARLLSWQYAFRPELRKLQLERMNEFCNALREINRAVCVDTYVNYHFTARHGAVSSECDFIAPALRAALERVHSARRKGSTLTDTERRVVFEAHFLHEQEHVVGPAVLQAMEDFAWPALRAIARRPPILFAFFPAGQRLFFRNFANRAERIERGMQIFDLAAAAGWEKVEATLANYAGLPQGCYLQPEQYLSELQARTFQAAACE